MVASKKKSREEGGLTTYRVRPGHSITIGEGVDEETGRQILTVIGPGQTVSLTKEEYAGAAHALDVGERRREGQLNRREKEIERLQAELDAQKELNKEMSKKIPKKDLDALMESFRNRGDNYIARGEAHPHGVPRAQLTADESPVLPSNIGDMEDMTGGMKGLERAHAGAGEHATSTEPDES
jgi:hypothetical protein